jgi:uncharacterized protein (DUF362 family)
MTRRQLLALLATGAGAAAAAPLLRRHLGSAGRPSEVHVLAPGTYDRLTAAALRAAVPAAHLPRIRGRRVLLKPNLVEYRPGHPVHTDPRLVAAAVEAFAQLGAADVVVGEGPGHRRDTDHLLAASGLREAVRAAGVRFIDLNLDTPLPRPIPGRRLTGLTHLHLPRAVVEADYVVSMPKMKTHHWVGVTLALKNLFGVLPGTAYGWPKNLFHWKGIPASILDVNRTVVADLAIVDGIVGMEGDGPLNGEEVRTGVVVVGAALAAVDATCCRLMGLRPDRVPYLAAAARLHGSIAARDITVRGAALDEVARPYRVLPAFAALAGGPAARGRSGA